MLELRVFVEVGQHFIRVGVFLELKIDADVFGRDVAHFVDQRQLPAVNRVRDALDQSRFIDRIGDRHDLDHGLLFCFDDLMRAPHDDGALAGGVDFAQIV